MSLQLGSKSYFYYQMICLKFGCHEISGNYTHNVRTKWSFWIFLVCTIFFLCCVLAEVFRYPSDLDVATEAFAFLMDYMLTLWKSFIFVMKKDDFMKLLNEINQLSCKANAMELKIIEEENLWDNKLCRILYALCVSTGLVCFLSPLVTSLIISLQTQELTLILLIRGFYPVDTTLPYNYIFISICIMLSLFFGTHCAIGVDTFCSWFMHNIVAHFRILGLKLQELSKDDFDLKSFISCIRDHQWILDKAQRFAKLFRSIIFLQFTLSSSQLCLLAFRIERASSMKSFILFIPYLSASFMQLLIYSIAGQRIVNESENISQAIYESFPWDEKLESNKKLRNIALIFLQRAQKPCQLDGIFFIPNFELCLWVLRTAGSFLALLKSFN